MLPIFQTYVSILRFLLSEFASFAYFAVKIWLAFPGFP
jgi:hypothetical protein